MRMIRIADVATCLTLTPHLAAIEAKALHGVKIGNSALSKVLVRVLITTNRNHAFTLCYSVCLLKLVRNTESALFNTPLA